MQSLYGIFKGRKTYIVSLTGIISTIASYLTGDIDMGNLLNTIFPLFSIIFLRSSMKKTDAQQ